MSRRETYLKESFDYLFVISSMTPVARSAQTECSSATSAPLHFKQVEKLLHFEIIRIPILSFRYLLLF